MSRIGRALLAAALGVALVSGLVLAFLHGREKTAEETEREEPVRTPSRAVRSTNGETVIQLDAETRRRAGIEAAAVAAAVWDREVQAFGTILDPAPFATLQGDLAAAEAALAGSAAQLARTQALFAQDQNASRRALETAEAQQRADAARRLAAQRRWLLALGGAPGKMEAAPREEWLDRLISHRLALARVELPPGEPPYAPTGARLARAGGDGPFYAARAVWEAPAQDGAGHGQAFLLELEQPGPGLRPGAQVAARLALPGGPWAGVILPAEAVVWAAGQAWAYVETGPDQFTRRPVGTEHPVPPGWFVREGFPPGTRVVVVGAQTLLSEEFKSAISVGEEAEKQ